MIRRPPRSTRTDTLFPYTTLFRSWWVANAANVLITDSLHADRLLCAIVGCRRSPPYPKRGRDPTIDAQSGRAPGAHPQARASRSMIAGKCREACAMLACTSAMVISCGSGRSEEHTSELQSLMRISYAV